MFFEMNGIKDMCAAMDVFIIGGGLSTSFTDIVPTEDDKEVFEYQGKKESPCRHPGNRYFRSCISQLRVWLF